jgi:thioredoxin reductase
MERPKPRLAVLGAGPIGLEAALAARKLGWTVTVYERGRVGEHLERWGFVRLFTPFGANSTALGRATIQAEQPKHTLPGEADVITGRDHVAAYLLPLASSAFIADCIRTETYVVGVGRSGLLRTDTGERRAATPFRLLLRDKQGQETTAEADIVFDCTGTYSAPRFLGDGGLPAAGELAARSGIAAGLEDVTGGQKAKYAGKSVLLVGAGYTAATHVGLLADLADSQHETWTIWLARGQRTTPVPRVPNDPLRERDRLAVRANSLATRGEGNVEFHASAAVDRVVSLGPDKGYQVTGRVAGKPATWDVDRVIASVGYRPDTSLYRELQIHDCPLSEKPVVHEPGFFVLGAKSFGRDSGFLLKSGFEQVRATLAAIANTPFPK